MRATTRRDLPGLVALLAALIVGAVHAARFRDFLSDDALISLRYAERLVEGRGLTWTDGEAVEGYSDLLWVLLTALLDAVGVDGVDAARFWGLVGFAVAIGAVSVDPETLRPQPRRALTGGLLLASTAGLAIWAMGGLEHTLQAGLVVAGCVAAIRAAEGRAGRWVAAALLGAVVLTRIDGLVLWAGLGVGWVLATRRAALRGWPMLVVPGALLAAQQAFRVVYYDDWVPNTARVKVSASWERALAGLEWTADALAAHAVLVVLAVVAAWIARDRPARWVLPLAVVAVWSAAVAWVGGDIFSGYRQLVPALPCLALVVAEGAARLRPRVVGVVALVAIAVHVPLASTGPAIDKTNGSEWVWAGRPIGRALARGFGAYDPLLAVDAAGALPYWSGLRALDMLGLTDRWLPRHPPPGYGGRGIGHDLGDGDYVWRRAPDLIVYSGTRGRTEPRFVSGKQLHARPDFDRVYQRVDFAILDGDRTWIVHVFVRREDGPLAVERAADRIRVPAWFFGSEGSPRVRIGREPRVTVQGDASARVPALPVPEGRWAIEAPEGVRIDVRCGRRVRPIRGDDVVLRIDAPTDLDLIARAADPDEVGRLGDVVLVRTDRPPTHTCGAPRP